MLEILRQLSADLAPSDTPQAPIAQAQGQIESEEVFSLPVSELMVLEEDVAPVLATLPEQAPVLPLEDTSFEATASDLPVQALIGNALPVNRVLETQEPALAEKWLAGVLEQQRMSVQAQSQANHVAEQPVAETGAKRLPEALVTERSVRALQVSMPVAQYQPTHDAPQAQSKPVMQAAPTTINTSVAMLTPAQSVAPLGSESVGVELPGALRMESLTQTPALAATSVRGLPMADEPALTERLMQTVRQSIDVQVRQNIQQATIRLDPPELGSLEIFLSHESGRLQVSIQAANADVARLLQHTSDRLRQDLVAANYLQVNVQVGSDSQSGREQRRAFNTPQEILNAQVFDEPARAERAPTDVLVTV